MDATPPFPPPVPPGGNQWTPTPTPAKKGLGVWAWLAIGCGTLLLLSLIAFGVMTFFVAKKVKEVAENPTLAAAKMIAFSNPDLELVGTDEDAQTVTYKKLSTGETLTFSWEDIKEGRINITDSTGKSTTLGVDEETGSAGVVVRDASGAVTDKVSINSKQEPPAWLLLPDGVTQQGGWVSEDSDAVQGLLSFKYTGSQSEVRDFFRTNLEQAGFVIETSSYQAGESVGLEVLTARDSASGREATISFGGEVGVFAVTFKSPK